MKVKKYLSLITAIIISLNFFNINTEITSAKTAEKDGLIYRYHSDGTAGVLGALDGITGLEIPNYLNDGTRVNCIEDGAFKGKLELETISSSCYFDYIGDYAFESCSRLKHVNLSGSLKTIGKGAFADCTSLNSIKLPSSVSKIGDGAFLFDKELSTIKFPKSLTQIGKYVFAFSGLCTAIVNEKITDIPERLFFGCAQLAAVAFLGNPEKIGKYAFADCKKLEFDRFPSSVKYIENGSFKNCYSIKELELSCIEIGESAFENSSLKSISFDENLQKIGRNAFKLNYLTEVYINDNVLPDESSFTNCGAENINVSINNPNVNSIDGVLFSEDNKTLINYPSGKKANSYSIPDGTERIADCAFAENKHLTKVIIPNSVYKIGKSAFEESAILSISIPEKVKLIEENTFKNCSKLEDIHLGCVESIKDFAFSNICTDKTIPTVKLPSTLKKISPMAFFESKCHFTSEGNFTSEDDVIFSEDKKKLILFPYIKDTSESYTVPEGTEEILENAFVTNSTVKKLHIPKTLTKIGTHGFGFYFTNSSNTPEYRLQSDARIYGSCNQTIRTYAQNNNIAVFSYEPKQNFKNISLKSRQFKTFKIKGANVDDVSFTSNDKSIAIVDQSGIIMGTGKGSTYIVANVGTTYFKCKVQVTTDTKINKSGFDESNYIKMGIDSYQNWLSAYKKNNPIKTKYFEKEKSEEIIAAYQGDNLYRAMNGAEIEKGFYHDRGLNDLGEGFEEMMQAINHSCKTELSTYKNNDSLVLYSGISTLSTNRISADGNSSISSLKKSVGRTFFDPIFVSGTLDEEIANRFRKYADSSVYIIYAEKTALNNLPAGYIGTAHSDFEKELLLGCGINFEVLDAGVRYVEKTDMYGELDTPTYQRYVKVKLLGGTQEPTPLSKSIIKLKSNYATLYIKKSSKISAEVKNTYNTNLDYTSENPKIASVDKNGKIYALKKGKTVIVVSNNGTKVKFTVNVINPKLNITKKTIKKGQSFKLKITGGRGTVKYSINNKKIASVNKNGNVKTKQKGIAEITVNVSGIKLRCKLTVK